MASVCAIRSLAGGSKFAMMLPYRRYDMDLRDERELALQRLRVLCHSGLFSILDFRHAVAFFVSMQRPCITAWDHPKTPGSACRQNPLNIFAAHEIAGFCDPSVATKMTVQFNLFGGTSFLQSDHKQHHATHFAILACSLRPLHVVILCPHTHRLLSRLLFRYNPKAGNQGTS